jgi:uncharacterized protein YlxW (UPF0749 family)
LTPHQKIADDLHKRFLQETKNYQSQNYELNQSINELDRTVHGIERSHNEKISKLQSDQKRLEIALENLTKVMTEKMQDCFEMLDRYQTIIDTQTHYINSMTRQLDERYVRQDWLSALQIDNVKRLDSLERGEQMTASQISNQYMTLLNQIHQSADNVMKDVMAQIPSTMPIKDRIEQMANEVRVNMDGLRKELERCKYNIYYGEKKFESIFTRLDSLEGKT